MKKFYYDLHIHTCLSPCGDQDMTPNNIVNMALLKGLDVIAVTDHNTCGNCAAVMAAGAGAGLKVLPGMELCTAENIHVVCLFKGLEDALSFADEVYGLLPDIKNREDIYGPQTKMDENDEVTGSEEKLLINAADISLAKAAELVQSHSGGCFPAHIDKEANGIIAILGGMPEDIPFRAVELSKNCNKQDFLVENGMSGRYNIFVDSDAHYLWQISEREEFFELSQLDSEAIISLVRH